MTSDGLEQFCLTNFNSMRSENKNFKYNNYCIKNIRKWEPIIVAV